MDSTFTTSSAIKTGWKLTKENRTLLFKVMLTIGALEVVSAVSNVKKVATSTDVLLVLLSTATGIASAVLIIGLMSISLKLVRGEKALYEDILPKWHTIWRFALVSIITGVITLIGFVLLIIPGIYLMLRFALVKFLIIDRKNVGIIEAMHESSNLTLGVKWELLGLLLVILLINILGVIPAGLGLLVTIPISMIALAHVYVALSKKASASSSETQS